MPANYDDLFSVFADLTGTAGEEQDIYPNAPNPVADADEWIDFYKSTGLDERLSEGRSSDAFEQFLYAFYPQEGLSGDDWWYLRQEFYEIYDITDQDIDWEAYREAIGYGRT
jgi:hypothetical protein